MDAHIRADDDTVQRRRQLHDAADAVQVSFDGGSTWKAIGTNPNSYGVDIGDLNVAIKLRQHRRPPPPPARSRPTRRRHVTALSDVTSFAVGTPVTDATPRPGLGGVMNRTRYQVDRATNSGLHHRRHAQRLHTGTGTSFSDSA